MRAINEIIIHCTATAEGRNVTVDELRAWHKQRGFQDIGYHYVVTLDGDIVNGRPITMCGAHCKGHNANSIGIAYVGGLDACGKPADTRTPAQRDALKVAVRVLRDVFGDVPVHGHNEYANKGCPCFDVAAEFGNKLKRQNND